MNSWGSTWGGTQSWLGSWGTSWGPLHEVEEHPERYYGNGRRHRYSEDDLIAQVRDKWETIERAQLEDAQKAVAAIPVIDVDHFAEPGEMVPVEESTPALASMTIDVERRMTGRDMALTPFFPDQAAAAIEARRKNNNEALMLILLDL